MDVRDAHAGDLPALVEALFEAANWNGQARFTRAQLRSDPSLSRYIEGWLRPGDFGSVAVIGPTDIANAGARAGAVGAAWCRSLPAQDAGYGYLSDDVPELSIGVSPAHRGHGVGSALLEAVITQAAARRVRAVSLSVEDGNRARLLYERVGFTVVGRNAGSDTMLLTLAGA